MSSPRSVVEPIDVPGCVLHLEQVIPERSVDRALALQLLQEDGHGDVVPEVGKIPALADHMAHGDDVGHSLSSPASRRARTSTSSQELNAAYLPLRYRPPRASR